MKYLICGNRGQLGRHFEIELDRRGAEYKGFDIDTLDIADPDATAEALRAYRPDVVLNCAAYNQVDLAEANPVPAWMANSDGPANLARIARELGARMVHYGTDYVFDGEKTGDLYTEGDEVNPLNEYSRSKLEGERRTLGEYPGALVLRVSWVFGPGTQNFIYKVMTWAREKPYLQVAFDEVSVPTYTGTIVDTTLRALDAGLSGLYHLTNGGYAARYEYARYAIERTAPDKLIYPVSKEMFNLPARRPYFSAMSAAAISKELGIDIPHWREAVDKYFKEFNPESI